MLDLGNRAKLIVGLGIFKALLELLLPRRIRRERIARQALSGGVELNESLRQVLGGGFRFGLRLLPLVAAEFIEPHRLFFAAGADVFADKIELRGRDVQHVRALIGNFHIVLHRARNLNLLHADVAADAVMLMHDKIARCEIGEGFELFAVRRHFFRRLFARCARENLPLGENSHAQRGILQTGRQRRVGDEHLPRLRQFCRGHRQKRVHTCRREHIL